MNYTPSREDYLISLYLLREKRGSVRSLDIVQMLGYSKPSVSNGLRLLRQNDLVWMDEIYQRYQIVLRFLREVLQVSEQIAYQDACKIEHFISRETLDRMRAQLPDCDEA